MNPVDNPFAPNAGIEPPQFAGRKDVLAETDLMFQRIMRGHSEKHIVLTGLRGVGKTVLLQKIEFLAIENKFCVARIEATGNTNLAKTLAKPLHKVLLDLNRFEGAKDVILNGGKALKRFLSGMNVKYGEVSVGVDMPDQPSINDANGNIELDLPELLEKISTAAKAKSRGLALLVDEMQFFTKTEIKAITLSIHELQQKKLPFVFVGAGLPMLPEIIGSASTYAERIFTFAKIGELSRAETYEAISVPIQKGGATIEEEALADIFKDTKGYPYFVQEWGYQAWNLANDKKITHEIMPMVKKAALKRLDKSFFPMRLERLPEKEKEYLYVVAKQADPKARSGDVAKALGKKTSETTVVRDRLIKKGILWAPSQGELEFTIPFFGEYVQRTLSKQETIRNEGFLEKER